ncbi:MAG: outer membrane beta-barrel protein [Pseudomonadales bacterium]|nr:outer membrane beta-barrel protein [Pseudomonadales bacterium]
MKSFSKFVFLTTLSLILGFSTSAFAQQWTYELEAYGQLSSINGDAGVGRVTGVPVDTDFDDILETLEAAAMIHFEAYQGEGWGFALDYGFMDLGADVSSARGGVVDATVHQGVFEAMAFNRRESGGSQLDYLIGVRWWDNDLDIAVDPAILPGTIEAEVEEDWIDLFVGVRWATELTEDWKFLLRGDVGGLGLQSDFTSTLSGGFQYNMSENWTLDLQYRATWVDFEDGSSGSANYFAYDTVTHGPLIGFIYKF